MQRVQPGSEIDGFVVGERLHAGRMSDVFRAIQSGSTRPLVMKVPHVAEDGSEGLVGFETEAMISPTLEGHHVAPFVAAGDLTRVPYLVFEWIEGQTLEDKIAAGRELPAQVATIGAAVADALHSVHQQNVIHLDIKPANVILRGDGSAVLIDFGLAHHSRFPDLLAEQTRYRAGSAPYVSPEQLLGVRSDPRSDLFALGAVLYELLTGTLPFGAPDSDVRNRFWLDPPPPAKVVADVPPWLQEILLRCLEPRAALRYQSAAHLAFDLRQPDQVELTKRATKSSRAGLLAHAKRLLRAHGEHAARLRSPPPIPSRTPVVLVAIDIARAEDELHFAMRGALSQFLAQSSEFRLLCLTVIPSAASSIERWVELRRWTEPLALPARRLSLHVVEAESPADVIVEMARYNNADLLVIGAPSTAGRAWSQSTAAAVTARVSCSVHVVRVPKRLRP